ncbi:hypothetical protein EDS67_06045 [candidate division KSB1 bacterium]|nr:MAG: hypothetical protein EDS67_06045 [candidate division KSB1 bacterium]MBC6947218.1 hypothetical protein [candidate division KSB1 bacterium]MCE7940297.1 hypothetical protein [Chlorobi bacterium CHB1]MDL1875721.1 hypothetical protein [Cytophagia bacterium CHB2]
MKNSTDESGQRILLWPSGGRFYPPEKFLHFLFYRKMYGLVTVEFLRGIYLPHPHGRACNIKQTVFTRESSVEKFDASAFASQQQKGSLP